MPNISHEKVHDATNMTGHDYAFMHITNQVSPRVLTFDLVMSPVLSCSCQFFLVFLTNKRRVNVAVSMQMTLTQHTVVFIQCSPRSAVQIFFTTLSSNSSVPHSWEGGRTDVLKSTMDFSVVCNCIVVSVKNAKRKRYR